MKPDKIGPCKGCLPPKRYPGCHDHCDGYISWAKQNEEEKTRMHNLKKVDRAFYEYRIEQNRKIKKEKGLRPS